MSVTGILVIVLLILGINLFRETASAFTIMNQQLDSLETIWQQAPEFSYHTIIYTPIKDIKIISDSLQSWQNSWSDDESKPYLHNPNYKSLSLHYLERDRDKPFQIIMTLPLKRMPKKYDQPITAKMNITIKPNFITIHVNNTNCVSTVKDHQIGPLKNVNARDIGFTMGEHVYSTTVGKFEASRQLEIFIYDIEKEIKKHLHANT
jgi:hypothetical protein